MKLVPAPQRYGVTIVTVQPSYVRATLSTGKQCFDIVARYTNTRRVLQYSAVKNDAVPNFINIGTLRVSFEWICHESCNCVLHSEEACRTRCNSQLY